MKAVKFYKYNNIFQYEKSGKEVPFLLNQTPSDGRIFSTTCWELTEDEIKQIAEEKKIYITTEVFAVPGRVPFIPTLPTIIHPLFIPEIN